MPELFVPVLSLLSFPLEVLVVGGDGDVDGGLGALACVAEVCVVVLQLLAAGGGSRGDGVEGQGVGEGRDVLDEGCVEVVVLDLQVVDNLEVLDDGLDKRHEALQLLLALFLLLGDVVVDQVVAADGALEVEPVVRQEGRCVEKRVFVVAGGADVVLRLGEVADLLLDVLDNRVDLPLDGVDRLDAVHVVVCSGEQLVGLRLLLLRVRHNQLVLHELVAERPKHLLVHAAELDEVVLKQHVVEENRLHDDDRLVGVEHVHHLSEEVFDRVIVHLERF